jgi:glycosyltransferase involved in cell wall biosynthesis
MLNVESSLPPQDISPGEAGQRDTGTSEAEPAQLFSAVRGKASLVVTLEEHFERTPDGRVWTVEQCGPAFWERYLAVFDEVRVVARVRAVTTPQERSLAADAPGVVFRGIPWYRGLAQYARHGLEARAIALGAVDAADAVILRVPSPIASLIAPALRSRRVPYAVEVVSDPYDGFSPGAVRHPLRPLIRWKMTQDLKRQAGHAVAAAYVTERALQERYPCPAFQTGYSSVELSREFLVDGSRPTRPRVSHGAGVVAGTVSGTRLISVGTFEQPYKAPDVLVDAVAICVDRGLDLTLSFVGQGLFLEDIRRRAERWQIGDRVRFEGHLSSRPDLIAQLDASDLFVLASRSEGLPRAMIEAMARGLPCIGSDVGGIPELLEPQDMVPPGDARVLASKIEEVVTTPARLAEMSARSLTRARAFASDVLARKRTEFYRHVLRVSIERRVAA